MPTLNFPVAKQEDVNSCWACASRMISNYYVALGKGGANKKIDSDTDLAKLVGLSIDKQESASAVLATLKYANNADSAPIPTEEEISDAISDGTPLLAIIGPDDPKGKRNLKAQNGHWVVIVGIDKSVISVFDPANGSTGTVAYGAKYSGYYWQNTSYVDGQ